MSGLIKAMSKTAVNKVRVLERAAMQLSQVEINTTHTIHSGVYTRTVMIPAGVMITGALIKIATTLIVSGNCFVYIDGKATELTGYNVLPAAAGRKQAFIAIEDTHLTMLFATDATTVEQAEEQFTDEADKLISRRTGKNTTMITGG